MEDPPNWLNKQFLESVLQGAEAEVLKFSVSPAVAAGNNYFSDLYRVLVHCKGGEGQTISLIVKAPVQRGLMSDISTGVDFYATEPKVYNDLLPLMKEKLNLEFGPKSFYCPQKNTLVLADLAAEGYIMLNKFEQLDFQHCKVVLENLAKFHATSVVSHRENPQLIETIAEEKLYSKDGSSSETFKWLDFCMRRLADIINEMDVQQSTKEYVYSRIDNIWETSVLMCKPNTDCLKVLNHGDCWTNNILFKHNPLGDVVDVKLIDFQFSRFTSPVLDLITFFFSSPNRAVRESKQQELYSIYLKTLNETFEKLGCEERFTAQDLRSNMKMFKDWALVVLSFDLPFFLSKAEDTVDCEGSGEDGESVFSDPRAMKLHQGQYYAEVLPELVKEFERLLAS